MSELDELIKAANNLCDNLERQASDEKKFCFEVCHELGKYSWEMHKMSNDIKQLKERFGG